MSTFKTLLTSDVVISPFEVNKSFTFNGSASLYNNGIDRFIGKNVTSSFFISGSNPTGYIVPQNQYLIYSSIRDLYFSNFLNNEYGSSVSTASFNVDGTITGERDTPNAYNYLQSTLQQSRYFPTESNAEVFILSIPSNLYGEAIQPGSFILRDNTNNILLYDNNEGNILSNSTSVGNIIYQHGIIIISNNFSSSLYNSTQITCSFSSSITLHELQYKCTIRENEFNFSQNSTLISGSNNSGVMYDFSTGSYFNPFVTTVGLYNNNKELLAVAKLSQPLPMSSVTDTSIIINLDL
jgi:hypothetical protein